MYELLASIQDLSNQSRAEDSDPEREARVQRVLNGLRPPVSIDGEPPATLTDRMKAHCIPVVSIAVILPELLSNTIEVVKLKSLASVVSLAELLYNANMARSITYNASPLVAAALIYLVLLWPLVRLVSCFQRRLAA